jgi:ABC-type Zn2+ transport system substrate-binding protein/surface adhesin
MIFVRTEGRQIVTNNKNENQIVWKGDYDGNEAKIKVGIDKNGKKKSYKIELDNRDIKKLLSRRRQHALEENDFVPSFSKYREHHNHRHHDRRHDPFYGSSLSKGIRAITKKLRKSSKKSRKTKTSKSFI